MHQNTDLVSHCEDCWLRIGRGAWRPYKAWRELERASAVKASLSHLHRVAIKVNAINPVTWKASSASHDCFGNQSQASSQLVLLLFLGVYILGLLNAPQSLNGFDVSICIIVCKTSWSIARTEQTSQCAPASLGLGRMCFGLQREILLSEAFMLQKRLTSYVQVFLHGM